MEKRSDGPIPGKEYRITGSPNEPAISNGNSWAESEVGGAADTVAKVRARIEEYAQLVTRLNAEYYTQMAFTFEHPAKAAVQYGSRYAKISLGSRIHTFIDLRNGDILKAATYRAPAPHARGSIFADDLGASAITNFGANHLR